MINMPVCGEMLIPGFNIRQKRHSVEVHPTFIQHPAKKIPIIVIFRAHNVLNQEARIFHRF